MGGIGRREEGGEYVGDCGTVKRERDREREGGRERERGRERTKGGWRVEDGTRVSCQKVD